MENKKNTRLDLSKRSVLFFQIGMILILLLVWQAIEWKTYERETSETTSVYVDSFEEEIIPITELPDVEPPELPVEITEEVEVIKDDDPIEETLVQSTESDQEDVIKVEDIKVVEPIEEIEDQPFDKVEEVPVFPGCENFADNEDRKQCMSDKIKAFVNREFDTSLGSELGLSGINRIIVQFRIEPDGTVTVIGARGPHPILEKEAIRIAESLPEMQPGRQRGKAVGVIYNLPIIFRVQN